MNRFLGFLLAIAIWVGSISYIIYVSARLAKKDDKEEDDKDE